MLCHFLSGLALSVTFGDTSPKGRGIRKSIRSTLAGCLPMLSFYIILIILPPAATA